MRKDFFNLRAKSKLLLLTLLALFAGGMSPAWAQVTETFDNLGDDVLPKGWGMYNSSNAGTLGTYYNVGSDYKKGTEGKSLYANYSSTNTYYIVTPVLDGTFSFYYANTSNAAGSIYIYEAEESGTTFKTKGNALFSKTWSKVSSQRTPSWELGSITLTSEKRLAIQIVKGAIDDITYTMYQEGNCKKPTNLGVSNITGNSADISWEAGEEGQDAWQLVYSTDANFDKNASTPINVNSTSYSLTGLDPSTTYYVAVRSYCSSEEQSNWASVDFKTLKVAVPATGFTDDFESNKGWDFINGTLTNNWVRGTATNNGGSSAMYISNDGGSTYAYSTSGATIVYAAKLFAFEAGDFTITYDWKANGESGWDFLRVLLVPSNVDLSAGTSLPSGLSKNTVPTGWQALDGGSELSKASDWANKSVDINIAEAGNYQVVFAWRNDGSGGTNPPAAIDNFKILGSAPVLEVGGDVVGTTLAFGSVSETTNKTIRITNSGKVAMENIALTETADADNVFAYADLTKTTLAANEYMDVQVTFSGSSAKDYTGTFRVAADDCDPIDVNVTATYSNSAATMAITLGEEVVGATVAFGSVGKQKTKTFTVTNDGDQTLNVTSIASNNTTDFTVTPSSLEIAGHSSETFTVTFAYPNEDPVLNAEKTANITVTASNAGIDPVVFAVTGTRIEQWSENFSGNKLPTGWTADENYWTFADGVAKSKYNSYTRNNYLFTPLLNIESTSETLTFDYTTTAGSVSIPVYYSKDGGDYTAYSGTPSSLANGVSGTFTITGLEVGSYKFRFGNDDYNLDNFEGFKLCVNDPIIAVYSNAEATAAVTSGTKKDFGWSQTAQTATYYIKNTGTGTLIISNISEVEGFTVATAENAMTVAADADPLALTITMTNAAEGAKSGTITITTDGGNFEIPVSGFVYGDKNYIDFSATAIPTSWINDNEYNPWKKNASGYISTTSNNANLQTSAFVASTGDKLYIERENKALTVKYKKVTDENWSDLASFTYSSTKKVEEIVIPDGLDGDKILLQFSGSEAYIYHIYGLTVAPEPHMTTTAADINFGSLTAESSEESFTITNDGTATLEGLTVTLGKTGENAQYSVRMTKDDATFTGTTLAAGESVTVYVKQLYTNYGHKSDVLTIAATDQTPVAVNLKGATRDGDKYYVAAPTITSNKFSTPALAIEDGEVLTFDVNKSSSFATFSVDYTIDGGLTWNTKDDYELSTGENNLQLNLGNTSDVKAWVVFHVNSYATLTNVYGGLEMDAPLINFTTSESVNGDGKYDFGQTLQAAPAGKDFTVTNTGSENLTSIVNVKGDVSIEWTTTEGEIDYYNENKVTLEPGETATLTVSLNYNEANPGAKTGEVTIGFYDQNSDPVAAKTLDFTANVMDQTMMYVDFSGNAKPAGWYNDGWQFANGVAYVYSGVEKELITEAYSAVTDKNVLSFDAKAYSGNSGTLKVYTSRDRKAWTLAKTVTLTKDNQNVALDALADNYYYVKFVSSNASIDNLTGLKKIYPALESDLYVTSATFPTTVVPGTKDGINVEIKVTSLIANEENISVSLYYKHANVVEASEELAQTATQTVNLDATATFNLTVDVPNSEGDYVLLAYVNKGGSLVAEAKSDVVTFAHTRTLSVTEFTRTDEGGDLTADANNKFSAAFNVKVQNTGSIEATPVVKIFVGDTQVGTATADAAVAAGESKEIAVNVTNASAGEGGNLAFTAKAYWTAEGEALATSASDVTINVTAAAPKFEMAVKGGDAVADGDAVAFGLVKTATTKTYTITNSGNKAMELVSIVAPEGFEATAVTEDNKTIAADGTLDIDVTLKAEQGKKNGNLVITYKVDESTNKTFTLALSGRSLKEGEWFEDFNEATGMPTGWTAGTWTVGTNANYNATKMAIAPTGSTNGMMITPRLAAKAGDVLSWTAYFDWYDEVLKVEYSNDDQDSWTQIYNYKANDDSSVGTTRNTSKEMSFTAPADGNYYLRFTSRYGNAVDDIAGFTLNLADHIMSITASSIPTSASYSPSMKATKSFNATVTVKESRGIEEANVVAKLYMGKAVIGTAEAVIVEANGTKQITITATPTVAATEGAQMYIEVTYAGGTLKTEAVTRYVAEFNKLELTEAENKEIETGYSAVYDQVTLTRNFVQGWNTFVAPVTVQLSDIDAEAVAFSFSGYNTESNELTFTKVTDDKLNPATPYVVYVPAKIDSKVFTWETPVIYSSYVGTDNIKSASNGVTFQGTYAPMAAGSLTDCFGLTAAGKIVKANSSTTMKGFRAYFTGVPVGASARFIGFIDDELTGIRMITVDQNVEGVFNLQGQKIQQMKKGGLYIINGKKQVVK